MQRNSKIDGSKFLDILMFNSQRGNLTTLTDLAEDFELEYGESVSKQGLDERFNSNAVLFLKEVLSQIMSSTFNGLGNISNSLFNSCQIRDSSRFGLPNNYASVYKGHGGATRTESMISLQYEMDLLSGNQIDLQLTSGCRNDQQDTKESSLNIAPNSLLIRDLGYVTSTYLKAIIAQKAYFLNRLPSQMQVFNTENDNQLIDFDKVYKKMKRYQLPFLEFKVQAGKKAQVPCRLIVYMNDEKTARHRIKRTTKNTKSLGYRVSKQQKIRSKLGLYITNVNESSIKAENIKDIYSLRWQIELVFKSWKSLCNISKIKKVKIERFECMLLAGLIWIMTHWKVFQIINQWFYQHIPSKTASMWKYFKHAVRCTNKFRDVVRQQENPEKELRQLISIAESKFHKETKKGQMPYIQALNLLYHP